AQRARPSPGRNQRKQPRAKETDQGPGLAETRLRDLHILIRLAHLFFQRVHLRITENLPPPAARDLVEWSRELPPLVLLVGSRHRHRWCGIIRSHHATCAEQQHKSGKTEA